MELNVRDNRKRALKPLIVFMGNNNTMNGLTFFSELLFNIAHVAGNLTNNSIARAAFFQLYYQKPFFIFTYS